MTGAAIQRTHRQWCCFLILIFLLWTPAVWAKGLGQTVTELTQDLGPSQNPTSAKSLKAGSKVSWLWRQDGYVLHMDVTFDAKAKAESIRWRSPSEIAPALLWRLLDWVGQGTDWVTVDAEAWLEPPLAKALGQGYEIAWVSRNTKMGAYTAKLKRFSGDHVLEVQQVDNPWVSRPAVELEYVYQEGLGPFSNWRLEGNPLCMNRTPAQCAFTHLDYPSLKLQLHGRELKFTYAKPDGEPIRIPTDYSRMSDPDKRETLEMWEAYLEHEFSVMLKAFVHSTRGLFNWQAWHWQAWKEEGFISKEELNAILKSGTAPSIIRVFSIRAQDAQGSGQFDVSFSTDANGHYFMEVLK